MRLVLVLYAEARDLLPANVEAYHDSYGVGSLYDTLARADREGRDELAEATAAWPRMLGLFRLIYFGSGHADLPVRAYGGQLFRPGDAAAPEPVLRALAALEARAPDRRSHLPPVAAAEGRQGQGARRSGCALGRGRGRLLRPAHRVRRHRLRGPARLRAAPGWRRRSDRAAQRRPAARPAALTPERAERERAQGAAQDLQEGRRRGGGLRGGRRSSERGGTRGGGRRRGAERRRTRRPTSDETPRRRGRPR